MHVVLQIWRNEIVSSLGVVQKIAGQFGGVNVGGEHFFRFFKVEANLARNTCQHLMRAGTLPIGEIRLQQRLSVAR